MASLLTTSPPPKAKWQPINLSPPLPRSSHTISIISGRGYIFGGEISPRQPVDNDMHIITLPSSGVTTSDYKSLSAKPSNTNGEVPEMRVGHTATVIGQRIFVFGGRGGKEMRPLEENGRVWVYDTRLDVWDFLDPSPDTKFPAARSYHAMAAIDKPIPSGVDPVRGEGYGTLFIHAGCPASGRLNDLWAFDIASRTWKELPSAPGKPRGGTSLCAAKNRLYRFGGFNGETEEGGQVDYIELAKDTFDDTSGKEDVDIFAKYGKWESFVFTEEAMTCPEDRSVAGLQLITTGMGREYLVLVFGEGHPSSQGHDGAGKFFNDVWTFQVPPLGMTAASFKDAALQALGKETGEAKWSRVSVEAAESGEVPQARGWFASASMGDSDEASIVLWGGLNDENQRMGDGWILMF